MVMERVKPRITSKQINFISNKIFVVYCNDKDFWPLINRIPEREKMIGNQVVLKTRSDFENFIKDNFNIEEGSLFIENILARDVDSLIDVLKIKHYNFTN